MIRELEKGRMISYLPPHYRGSGIMNALLATQEREIDELYRALEEILDQFFITSATWGLYLHEESMGLPVNENMPFEERRQRALTKRRGVSQPILGILQAIAPALEVRWSAGVIPFILPVENNADDYNFGLLVPTLEIRKPAGKAYSFTLQTPDETSGYTIYGEHSVGRGKVAFQPIADTVSAGRWPRWDTVGHIIDTALETNVDMQDYGFTYKTCGITPDISTLGCAETADINVSCAAEHTRFKYTECGTLSCGTYPAASALGCAEEVGINVLSEAESVRFQYPECGELLCGTYPA
jgi:hypothetical protein